MAGVFCVQIRVIGKNHLRFGNAQAGTTMESIISEQADHLISELKKVVGKSIDIKVL